MTAKSTESPRGGKRESDIPVRNKEENSETVIPDNHKSKIPLPVDKGVHVQDYNKCTCIARDTQYVDSQTKSQATTKVDAAESVRKFKFVKIRGNTKLWDR